MSGHRFYWQLFFAVADDELGRHTGLTVDERAHVASIAGPPSAFVPHQEASTTP